jgi:hypothetical protein
MKQYSVQVHGTDLDWPETRPPFSRVIEARVHAQRSSHQFNRESGSGGCVRQAGHPDEVHETNLRIETGGLYWFRTDPKNSACVFIDGQLVIDQRHGGRGTQGAVELAAGAHALEMQFWGDTSEPLLQWVPPGLERWRWSDVGNEQQAPRD